MTPEQVFKIANAVAIIPWILMTVAPRWNITEKIINSYSFPALLACVYIFYILISLGRAEGGFSTLDGVASLFKNKNALLAGWVHYLVFDLFVGTWEWRDSIQNNISHFILVPCLFLTLMFGPAGFLIYYLIRLFLVGSLI
ncbi:MAG TPA: ABA4-like family protein [Leptospiraceae bacterium]|nr:ABA4-like family protein [Leptospiraceae bacterium]HMW04584.1 ABA4-like family protein [Leptospiraceae bacterium]HMX33263.1 ABA4-like family protein [Leptospiraceae bacterium]HMY30770.1 ABA4-like family protein [Leptospiraceae bacterium]HMZ66734.1 ABA4-like family protein [Leptospiraceae bacterium]